MNASPFARVSHVRHASSTSTLLRESATAEPEQWPHLSAIVADHQSAGRGRTGRAWQTPPGTALTASVLVRPQVPVDRLSWLTLLTGLATVRALGALTDQPSPPLGLKWPNDVLVDGAADDVEGWGSHRKVAGILAEVVPGTVGGRPGEAVVVLGIGVNLRQEPAQLPVPWATSLASAGLPVPAPLELLDGLGRELVDMLGTWEAHGGDVTGSGLREAVRAACLTLGQYVRIDGPGGATLRGTAEDIDDAGRLTVRDAAGHRTAVLAGDVTGLRNR